MTHLLLKFAKKKACRMTGHLKPPALFIFFKVRRQGLPSTLTVFVMNVASFLGSFLPTPRPRLAFVTAASLSLFF